MTEREFAKSRKKQAVDYTEVYETPFGEVICGRCGYEIECDDCGDMPEKCPDCGANLNYGIFDSI